MLYVREPTEAERKELKRMKREEVGRVSVRAHMVLLSADGWTVPKLALLFEQDRQWVRRWVKRFDKAGPAGLYDQPRSGRPRKVSEEVENSVLEWIKTDPAGCGYLATFWTVAMLLLTLKTRLGVVLSASSLREMLHRLGLSWGRPRLGMPDKTDPDKAAKQWAIARAVVGAGPETSVVYVDESRIELLPLIRAMWHWTGQQLRIPTPGSNASRAVFGALNILTGQWDYLIRHSMKKEDFIAFLEHLLTVYPSGPLIVIADNYSSHTAHLVSAWLVDHPRVQLLFLPKYCSHLNPVENIWLRLKNTIAPNRLYCSMALLLDTTHSFFDRLTPQLALHWAAV
jgi:transposase